jgi:hypothetical protein
VRKLNRVVEVLALAAVVFMGCPDTAMAANLNFSSGGNAVIPPLVLTISGPGATNSTSVTVSTTGTLGTISATAVTGTGGN